MIVETTSVNSQPNTVSNGNGNDDDNFEDLRICNNFKHRHHAH